MGTFVKWVKTVNSYLNPWFSAIIVQNYWLNLSQHYKCLTNTQLLKFYYETTTLIFGTTTWQQHRFVSLVSLCTSSWSFCARFCFYLSWIDLLTLNVKSHFTRRFWSEGPCAQTQQVSSLWEPWRPVQQESVSHFCSMRQLDVRVPPPRNYTSMSKGLHSMPWCLSAKQVGIRYQFIVSGMTWLGIEPKPPNLRPDTWTTRRPVQ